MGLGKRAASFPCLALGSHSILQLESRGLKISWHSGSQTWVAVRTWRGGGWWSHRSLVLSIEGSNPAIWGGGMKICISNKFSSETWSHTMLSCYAWIHQGPERRTDLQRLHPHRPRESAFIFRGLALSLTHALQPSYLLLHRSLTLILRWGSSFWSWRQEWSACLPAGNFCAFVPGNSLHAWERGKGLWKRHSTLLLVGEGKPRRLGAPQKWAWLSDTVMRFLRLEFLP